MHRKRRRKRQKLQPENTHLNWLKHTKCILHEHTPLPTVLQAIVLELLRGAGTLFVADIEQHVLLAVTLPEHSTRILAGQSDMRGHADGEGSKALFDSPWGLAFDLASKTLFVGQLDGGVVRRVALNGTVSTFSGRPYKDGFHGHGGVARPVLQVQGCAIDGPTLLLCDTYQHCIRRMPFDGSPATLVAGRPGVAGSQNGGFADATFYNPHSVAADGKGNDWDFTVRKIASNGAVKTLATGSETRSFRGPLNLAWHGDNRLFAADSGANTVSAIDLCTREVQFVASFERPVGLVVDLASEDLYVSHRAGVSRVSPNGHVDEVLHARQENYFGGLALF